MPDPTSRPHGTAREIAVPQDMRTLSALSRIDYENAIRVEFDGAGDRTAQQWFRAILEGAPAELREALVSGWSSVLGLRLGPLDSDRHVLGWPIRHSTPDEVVLSTSSDDGLHGELVVQRTPDAVLTGSFIRLDTAAVRRKWNEVLYQHTPAMCQLLDGAVSRVVPA
ncbi:hypothetical protein [Saccharopolyspora taberi]|uniref:DUF2867 domain-containing protein n=1 Tax=Saccharopolyspora taberi TaxID=60895 RepID=A0ABN3VBA3_9PSEU